MMQVDDRECGINNCSESTNDQQINHLRKSQMMDESETGSMDTSLHKASATKPNYQRRPKPPFSYIALIAMAIRDSQSKKLTLAEINDYLMKKFPFFRGEYTGWRNSVRHNLSLNECFKKVLRDPNRPWGKDNYWMLNESSDYTFADGVFRRRRKRLHKKQRVKQETKANCCRVINNFNPELKQGKPKPRQNSSFLIDDLLAVAASKKLSSSSEEDESSCHPPTKPEAATKRRSPSPKHQADSKWSHQSINQHCNYPIVWPTAHYLHNSSNLPNRGGWPPFSPFPPGNLYPFVLPQVMHTSFNPHSIDMSQHLAAINQNSISSSRLSAFNLGSLKNGHFLYNVVG